MIDGFSRGTDHPLGGVVEDAAPRVWRVGDVVEGADYAALPVGTTVWGRRSHPDFWWDVVAQGTMKSVGQDLVLNAQDLFPRVIRSLPAAPAAAAPFDAAKAPVGTVVACGRHEWLRRFVKHEVGWEESGKWWSGDGYVGDTVRQYDARDVTITYPPAPAERQPCAAWVRAGPQRWQLVRAMVTTCIARFTVYGVAAPHVSYTTLRAAQLAAEDALEADAREVLRLLGVAP